MLRNVFAKMLYDRRKSIWWWMLGLVGLIMMQALFYPSIRDNNDFAKAMESLPADLMAFMNVPDSMDLLSPTGYMHSQLFGLMLPLVVLIFTIGVGARAIAGEEESRTLDLLLANPLRRSQVVIQSLVGLTVLSLILGVAVFLATYFGGLSVDMGLSLANTAAASVNVTLLGLVFGVLTLAIGAATGKRGLAIGIASAAAVAAYLMQVFSSQIDSIEWMRWLSPFYYAAGTNALNDGFDWLAIAVLLAVSAALGAVAVAAFERRDLAV